jgi:protein-disulfide isomerase
MTNREARRVGSRRRRRIWLGASAGCIAVGALLVATQVSSRTQHLSRAQTKAVINRRVDALLAGIPQQGDALGSPRAPITLQVFGDLQCLDVKYWFGEYLPAIIHEFVRPNVLRIEYRAMKTDTLNPEEFVVEHTAARAAGAQNLMWNFLATFYYEQKPEYTNYATEQYLTSIAEQVRELDLARWNRERIPAYANGAIAENRMARRAGFHDTPAFRIGRTGGALSDLSGRHVIVYPKYRFRASPNGRTVPTRLKAYAHPVSPVDTEDIREAIKKEY